MKERKRPIIGDFDAVVKTVAQQTIACLIVVGDAENKMLGFQAMGGRAA